MKNPPLLPTFTNFGPCHFAAEHRPPPVHRVDGLGARKLLNQLKQTCPKRPGIYAMSNRDGEILYIGKAKQLRVRLLGYFRPRSRTPKAGRIIRGTAAILWEKWPHEFCASLRELELIRRWRPGFNVQGQPLRRELTYVCLGGQPAPYFFLSRKPPVDCVALAGPISLQHRTRDAVQLLNNMFGLRDCPQKQLFVFSDDRQLFPSEQVPGCLRYEIGNCLGPCAALCSRRQYRKRVSAARDYLNGSCDDVVNQLRREMEAAAKQQKYERAVMLRNKLELLDWFVAQLASIRRARSEMSFVYRVSDDMGNVVWYLIHGSRTVRAIYQPNTKQEKKQAFRLLQSIYAQQTDANLIQSYEHLDGMTLVSSWFLRHPDEMNRTMSPDESMAYCHR